MKSIFLTPLFHAIIIFLISTVSSTTSYSDTIVNSIKEILAHPKHLPLTLKNNYKYIHKFYTSTSRQPIWINSGRMEDFIKRLRNAQSDGLSSDNYPITFLEKIQAEAAHAPTSRQALIELWFSAHFLRYAEDIKNGRHLAQMVYGEKIPARKPFTGALALEALAQTSTMERFFQVWEPYNQNYRTLKQYLAHYQKIKKAHGFPYVPMGPTIQLGDEDTRLSTLRKRLILDGLLSPSSSGSANPDVFDEEVQAAVLAAQYRYGIPQTGKLNKKTVIALNIPVTRRIEQIELAIERQRWLPSQSQGVVLSVNANSQELQVWEEGALTRSFPMIANCAPFPELVTVSPLTQITYTPARGDREVQTAGLSAPIGQFYLHSQNIDAPALYDIHPVSADTSARTCVDDGLHVMDLGFYGGIDFATSLIKPSLRPPGSIDDILHDTKHATFELRTDTTLIRVNPSATVDVNAYLRFHYDGFGADRRLRFALLGKHRS